MYDPFWSSAYLHPGLYRGFAYAGPNMGQIKLDAPKDASVYLDGAFAGTVQKLKSIWLEPGIYELQVASPAGGEYQKESLRAQRQNAEYSRGAEAMKRLAGVYRWIVCVTRRYAERITGSVDAQISIRQKRVSKASRWLPR